jgi:4-amino-4-deoxy-L-arabinose transferase-like glycosyltransferase
MVFGIAGGWFAAASARYPEYPHYAFVQESLERLTTGSFQRQQPAWFAPVVLVAGALPWSLATPWGRGLTRRARLGLGFVLFAVVFFTLSHSKLVTYLLPAVPMMAWAAAEAWSDPARARRGDRGVALVYAGLAAAFAAAGFTPALSGARPPLDPSVPAAGRLLAAACAVIALLALAAARFRPGWGFAGALLFTPLVLLGAGRPLLAYAASQSGDGLARAVRDVAPGARLRYEFCYSPGSDFLLGRRSQLVSERGHETTSNYQVRYRAALMARGEWTPLDAAPRAGDASVVVVRPARSDAPPPEGYVEFYRDGRFVALRRVAAGP